MLESKQGSPASAAGGERAGVKTVAICNQKGGVGKTTIALGLASAAVSRGVRTLVIDMDSQSNASDALLGDLDEAPAATSYDVLLGERGCAPPAITDSPWGMGVIAGSLDSGRLRADERACLRTAPACGP